MKIFGANLIRTVVVFGGLSAYISAQTQNPQAPSGSPLVKLDVIVTDGAGHAVNHVRKEDLQLSDGGRPEIIEAFSSNERPLTYGLVIDSSNSLNAQFGDVLKAAKQIIAGNRDGDKTFIIKFASSDNIRTVHELTADKNALIESLNSLKPEMGQTAVIDGLYLAVEYANKHSRDGETIPLILLSDGEERASYYKETQLFDLLAKSNVQVFPVGIVEHLNDDGGLIRLSPRQMAVALLTKLAEDTGGRAFVLRSKQDLPAALEKLIDNLHSRYVIVYRPTKDPDKGTRKVRVKLVTTPDNKKWTVISPRVIVRSK